MDSTENIFLCFIRHRTHTERDERFDHLQSENSTSKFSIEKVMKQNGGKFKQEDTGTTTSLGVPVRVSSQQYLFEIPVSSSMSRAVYW